MTTRALVTGGNAKFLPGVLGTLRSARRFHPDVARFCLAPAAELDAVRAGVGDLAEVVAAPRPVAGVPDRWLLQLLAARVFVGRFAADTVAWVDADALFAAPAPELWDVPKGRANVVADAVYTLGHMVPADVWDVFARQFGVAKTDRGFNAGVYALNTADWADLPERYEAALAAGAYPYYPPGFDQALLNGVLGPHANWLPRSFNAHALFELGVPAGVRVVHYTDNPKPWAAGYRPHWPGAAEWAAFGEDAPPGRVARLRLLYRAGAVRRLGYTAARQVLTKAGVWGKSVGVADGPATDGGDSSVRPTG